MPRDIPIQARVELVICWARPNPLGMPVRSAKAFAGFKDELEDAEWEKDLVNADPEASESEEDNALPNLNHMQNALC